MIYCYDGNIVYCLLQFEQKMEASNKRSIEEVDRTPAAGIKEGEQNS